MLEYLTMLLVISLILIAILSFVKKRIPLRPWIIYSAVGISFALGSVFPIAISTLTTGKVLTIYFVLIVLIATVLSYAESRVYVNVSSAPLKIADLEVENLTEELVKDSFSSILAEETAALEACAAMDHPSNTDALIEEPGAILSPKMEFSVHDKGASAVDVSTDYQHQSATGDIEKEDTPLEEELPLKFSIFMEETFQIEDVSTIEEEPSVKVDLPESTDDLDDKNERIPKEETLFDAIQDSDGTGVEYPAQEDFSLDDKLPAEEKLPDRGEITEVEEPLVWEEPKHEDLITEKDLLLQNRDTVEEAPEVPPPGPATTAKVIETFPDEDKFSPSRDVEKDDYISSGFRAKSAGDLAGAVKYFITALQTNQEQQITAALALEISAIYQELGQYFQAGIIMKSVMEQENVINDFTLRQTLQSQLIYLDTLTKLLRITEMTNAPYSKIPNIIKIKANLETAKRLNELTEGGRISEKQQADFRAPGS